MKGFLNRVAGGGKGTGGESMKAPATESKPSEQIPPRNGIRRKSAFSKQNKVPVVKELPLLQETPMLKREALFRQKLQLCNVIFDFENQIREAYFIVVWQRYTKFCL